MLALRKPTPEQISRFLAAQNRFDFTYTAIGATATTPPTGYVVDHTRTCLGVGPAVFAAAQSALRRWEQFNLGWLQALPADTPIVVGQEVAILARVMGSWWLNACRIVYLIDDPEPLVRFGFAYGTLPGHAETGEERFLIEWNRADDSVWFDVLAFSRPRHPLVRVAYPLARRLQKCFCRESAKAMLRAVAS